MGDFVHRPPVIGTRNCEQAAAQLRKYHQQGLTLALRTAPASLHGRLRPCWAAMAGYGPAEAALLPVAGFFQGRPSPWPPGAW